MVFFSKFSQNCFLSTNFHQDSDASYLALQNNNSNKTIKLDEVKIKAKKEEVAVLDRTYKLYSSPDATVKIDATNEGALQMAGVMEFLKGRIAGLVGGKIRGQNSFFGDITPLLLIDGLATNNFDMLPAMAIDKIEVVKSAAKSAMYGSRGASGIINVITKKGSLSALNPIKSDVSTFVLKGFDTPKEFYSPDYSKAISSVPDYRTTIYWNPNFYYHRATAVLSFFAADIPTTYRIVLEGMTKEGKIGRVEETIEVRK